MCMSQGCAHNIYNTTLRPKHNSYNTTLRPVWYHLWHRTGIGLGGQLSKKKHQLQVSNPQTRKDCRVMSMVMAHVHELGRTLT